MIWNNRKVKVENGSFILSAVGQHDNFNFTDDQFGFGAIAGNPGRPVVSVSEINDWTLDVGGAFIVDQRGDSNYNDFVIAGGTYGKPDG